MIKELRIKYNLTQKQLAAILGCHYRYYNDGNTKSQPINKYLLKLLRLSKD